MQIGNEKTERAFLGSMLMGDQTDVYGLDVDYFFYPAHKKIFEAMYLLLSEGSAIDIITVGNKLLELGNLDDVGGNMFIIELTNGVFTSSNIENYAKILKEEYKRVRFLKIAEKMNVIGSAGSPINGSTFEIAKELLDLNVIGASDNYNVERTLSDTTDYIERNKGKEIFGYSSGVRVIDEYAKGLQPGKTYRIGAPSNLGKTSIAYNIINSLIKQGAKVAFFSLENDKEITMIKLLANYQGCSPDDITNGTIAPDLEYIRATKNKFFLIDGMFDVSEIFGETMKIKPDVVVLDYIGLVEMKRVKEDDKYTEYAKQVQQFVKRERVSWVDLSNLPKAEEDEENLRNKGGFYGSSFLKNNADFGLHLFYTKGWYESKDKMWNSLSPEQKHSYKNKQALTLFVSKNRLGPAKQEQQIIVDFGRGAQFEEVKEESFGDIF